ncbi:MAG: methionine synthase [Firmicutes bacterium]|nr:methionine synthase [Bacillota bacterium]
MDTVQTEIKSYATPRVSFKEYAMRVEAGAVVLEDGTVFNSANLADHLSGSEKCAVLAATLGAETDAAIRLLQYKDMAAALAADNFANALIEEVCDKAEAEIAETARKQGFYTTTRYSCGYGDFSLSNQPDLLRLTNAQRVAGITVNESHLLLPQKSVTAIIGYWK